MYKSTSFEAICYSIIRKEFPYFNGWLLSHRKQIGSICGTVSWVVQRNSEKILIFCEMTKALNKERIANVSLCKDAIRALKAIIFIPGFTNIDQDALEYAKEKNIEIRKIG